MSHRVVQGELRATGWRRRSRFIFNGPSSLSILLQCFPPSPPPLGCVEQSFTERDRSHLEPQPWGQTWRQRSSEPTPQKHTNRNTLSSLCVPKCVEAPETLLLTIIIYAYGSSEVQDIVVSVMQGIVFTWFDKAGQESLYFKNSSH